MKLFDLNTYVNNIRTIGAIAIVICLTAWILDWAGAVYVCPYCRTQRTVIGILGVMLILPSARHWISRYISAVIGFFGATVAANQHFFRYRSLLGSKANEHDHGWISSPFYLDPFLLSGAALFIIVALVWLTLFQPNSSRD
tara:strand:+ start:92 stop:514 length:423 start_codon:yes stop_codon:yes gene_type:complete